jgi:hypothetical protein
MVWPIRIKTANSSCEEKEHCNCIQIVHGIEYVRHIQNALIIKREIGVRNFLISITQKNIFNEIGYNQIFN